MYVSKICRGTNEGQKCGKDKLKRENMVLKTAYLISMMSARSPLICSAVELWYKKMLKIGSLSELTGIDTKIKVAGFQRLYSKWLWLLMAVYKPLFADAENIN